MFCCVFSDACWYLGYVVSMADELMQLYSTGEVIMRKTLYMYMLVLVCMIYN